MARLHQLLANVPKEKYGCVCRLSNGEAFTVEWLAGDYVEHMEHHLRQIFQKA